MTPPSPTRRSSDPRVSARAVAASRYYRAAAGAVLVYAGRACALGFAAWLFGLALLRGAAARRRERALEDRVIAGTSVTRSEEHTSELQSLMRISYAVFCLKKKKK